MNKFIPIIGKAPKKILEIGCGNGELAIGLAKNGYECLGVDVSATRIDRLSQLKIEGASFDRVEGSKLPFPDNSFDVVVSMQLFEHLHPDDAVIHLKEVLRVLKDGGRYILETPNKFIGPGDVSRFFVDKPEGFHLREYSVNDLASLFLASGYSDVKVILRYKRRVGRIWAVALEKIWSELPKNFRRRYSFGFHNPLYEGVKGVVS